MKTVVDFPPSTRGALHVELTVNALRGDFRLQIDPDTDCVQYPPREAAAGTLNTNLVWEEQDSKGTVLATTILRVSGSEYFRKRLPWPIALVEGAKGTHFIAHALDPISAGDTVQLDFRLDRSGRSVVCASALSPSPTANRTTVDFAAVRGEFLVPREGTELCFVGDGADTARLIAEAVASGARSADDGWLVRTDFA